MRQRFLPLLLAAFFLFQGIIKLRADEGMWLPILLDQLSITDMKARGFKLSAEDIYSVNKSSMKDAVCQFGGGCTAELISGEGLLLTNHHCGYGAVQALSTMQNDYIANGFWAMSRTEEKPCAGLTVTFIVRMEDVTTQAMVGVTDDMVETSRDSVIRINSDAIAKKAIEGTGYEGFVRAFYNGNAFYLFVVETFKDIRLVGVPPVSIGNYGGDTDNWAWPRQTGDFSMFRIYAGKDNKPAKYSPDNVPYKPKKFFPVSIKGLKEGDFTMVYGFPGRTTEYLSSDAVDLLMNTSDPLKVAFRDTRLSLMKEDMLKNDTVFLQYTAKYNGAANSWKKWKGEVLGLTRNSAVTKKRLYEIDFADRVSKNPDLSKKYGTLLSDMKEKYAAYTPWQKAVDGMNEGPFSIELVKFAGSYAALIDSSTVAKPDTAHIGKLVRKLIGNANDFYKDYRPATDKRIAAALLVQLRSSLDTAYLPAIYRDVIDKKFKGNVDKYIDDVYSKSIFADKKKLMAVLNNYKAINVKKISLDPTFLLWSDASTHFYKKLRPTYDKMTAELARYNRIYMKAQMEVMKEKKFYPDANSTLRVAYGKIDGYSPRDGMRYTWYTTLDGVMEKEDPKNPDFTVLPKLKTLWMNKDFGNYADKTDGKIHTCFMASNHTTGGNSGSPVLDAQGNLIGTNFDRVWEGTMSDVMFDPTLCRNIVLDVRYTLFVIDKVGGAGYLLNEMKIISK